MRKRRDPRSHEEARWRSQKPEGTPEYDEEYGLHGDDRRQYRGRESYEQQSRGGQGGRSGVFDHRFLPREYGENYRSNAQEDRQGYGDVGRRSEFESSYRGRPAFEREHQSGYQAARAERGPDAYSRYGSRPEEPRRARWDFAGEDDYSRSDYGSRSYHPEAAYAARESGHHYDEYEYGGRDIRPSYGSPYSRPMGSEYEARPQREGRPYSGEASRYSGDERGTRFDQGRYLSGEYGREYRSAYGAYDPRSERRPAYGPKNYKRSDERIREDVCDRLSHQWDLDASEIEVTVSNGEVTLTGTVQDRVQKHRVENIADGVSGVGEVHNQLRIKRDWGTASAEREAPATQNAGAANPRNTSQNRSS